MCCRVGVCCCVISSGFDFDDQSRSNLKCDDLRLCATKAERSDRAVTLHTPSDGLVFLFTTCIFFCIRTTSTSFLPAIPPLYFLISFCLHFNFVPFTSFRSRFVLFVLLVWRPFVFAPCGCCSTPPLARRGLFCLYTDLADYKTNYC